MRPSTPPIGATLCAWLCLGGAAHAQTLHVPDDEPDLVAALFAAQEPGYEIVLHSDQINGVACIDLNVSVTIRAAEGEGPFAVPAMRLEEGGTLRLERVRVEGGCFVSYPQGQTEIESLSTLVYKKEGALELEDVELAAGHEGVGVHVRDADAAVAGLVAEGLSGGSAIDVYAASADATLLLQGSELRENEVSAVYARRSVTGEGLVRVTIEDSLFERNQDSFGRAVDLVLIEVEEATVERSVFVGDGQLGASDRVRYGGSVYAEDTKLIVDASSFSDYRALEGGAIMVSAGRGGGGGLTITGADWGTEGRTVFSNNAALLATEGGYGGAISAVGVPVFIRGVVASGNAAFAGAFLSALESDEVVLRNAQLVDHEVGLLGGVVNVVDSAGVELQHVQLCGVEAALPASGAALVFQSTRGLVKVRNSVIEHVNLPDVPLIFFTGATLLLRNNTLHDIVGLGMLEFHGVALQLSSNLYSEGLATPLLTDASAVGESLESTYNLLSPHDAAWFTRYALDGEGTLLDAPPGFVDSYTSSEACAALPLLAEGSAARDAGDPDPRFDEADGSRSDVGAFGGEGAAAPDEDGDGFNLIYDCDDADPQVNPEAVDDSEDGVDQDCDGIDGAPVSEREVPTALVGGCAGCAALERTPPLVVILGLLALMTTRRQRCSPSC